MPWPKSLLAQIVTFAVALAILLPLAAPGAARNMAAYYVLGSIWGYALPVVLAHWVAADMRERGRTPPYELPFLLLLAWPISLFWYCTWTRGGGGLLLALGLTLLSYLPLISMSVLELVRIVLSS
jgi:hypothetical protein